MLVGLTGTLIVILFTLRPFVYKPASREFSPEVSSYFTALWCFLFALPTIPFCWDYFFIEGQFIIFSPLAVLFPFLKGISLYFFMKYNQEINKESTSGSVFWGVIGLALVTLISTFVFHLPLDYSKQIIILLIGILGLLFFLFGEGRKLTAHGKKAFVATLFFAVLNNLCDVLSIQYANWYILYMVPTIGMLLCAIKKAGGSVSAKQFFTKRDFIVAGSIYAAGEMILIFSMQSFFPVIVAIFLIRLAQGIDLILAYHISKEGTAGVQYFFGVCIVVLAYFFFFGI